MEAITPEALLFQLRAIATTDVTDLIRIENGQLSVIDSDSLTREQKAAVASIEKSTGGIKLKLYDKLKALELLCRLMGLGEASLSPPDDSLLAAIANCTGEVIDVHDIPELQQTPENCAQLVESAGDL